MSNQIPNSTVDPYDYLKIVPNPDGTITRLLQIPNTPATPDPSNLSPVLSKDLPLNPTRNTWIRIFLPDYQATKKLPLIVYYHAGFISLRASSCMNHYFCSEMAAELSAIVVSVDFRLAPEHRLPAAYEDAVEALHWIKSTDETWLREFCDVSTCFLMGTSAGGNITYHAGLRASSSASDELAPLKIRGLILHQPFFGGVRRTASEVRLVNDPDLPLSGSDVMWELALPNGVDRDHEYCNPMVDDQKSEKFDRIRRLGWRVLVTGCDGDPLIDRQVEFVEMLKKKGVEVLAQFHQGDHHGVELMDLNKAKTMFHFVKDFIKV